jgi:hypothetical protein
MTLANFKSPWITPRSCAADNPARSGGRSGNLVSGAAIRRRSVAVFALDDSIDRKCSPSFPRPDAAHVPVGDLARRADFVQDASRSGSLTGRWEELPARPTATSDHQPEDLPIPPRPAERRSGTFQQASREKAPVVDPLEGCRLGAGALRVGRLRRMKPRSARGAESGAVPERGRASTAFRHSVVTSLPR